MGLLRLPDELLDCIASEAEPTAVVNLRQVYKRLLYSSERVLKKSLATICDIEHPDIIVSALTHPQVGRYVRD